MKPMLASDFEEGRAQFPLFAQPKVDGVRALNMTGNLTGRSLKAFKNKHVTRLLSHSALRGLDGEMTVDVDWNHPELCSLTTSALNTIEGEPRVRWYLFDYVTIETKDLPYEQRLVALNKRLFDILTEYPGWQGMLRLMPTYLCKTMRDLQIIDDMHIEQDLEGTITRKPDMPHKQGRSTAKELGLNRIKRFITFEFRITGVIEGNENQNEATINELGHTERSSHQENMVPNGMVGALTGVVMTEMRAGDVVFEVGQEIKVGAGRLNHADRKRYFEDPSLITGKIGVAKFFPKGVKEKLRFPTFQNLRAEEDMS